MQRLYFLLVFITLGCSNQAQEQPMKILPGAYQTNEYLPLIEDKKVGLTVNHFKALESTLERFLPRNMASPVQLVMGQILNMIMKKPLLS